MFYGVECKVLKLPGDTGEKLRCLGRVLATAHTKTREKTLGCRPQMGE